MKLAERCCEACGARADGEPSAHFARVVWLCSVHSKIFHEPQHLNTLRSVATTELQQVFIDAWLERQRPPPVSRADHTHGGHR